MTSTLPILNNIRNVILQPSTIAIAASVGLHGMVGVTLPVFSFGNNNPNNGFNKVQVVQLTPEEQKLLATGQNPYTLSSPLSSNFKLPSIPLPPSLPPLAGEISPSLSQPLPPIPDIPPLPPMPSSSNGTLPALNFPNLNIQPNSNLINPPLPNSSFPSNFASNFPTNFGSNFPSTSSYSSSFPNVPQTGSWDQLPPPPPATALGYPSLNNPNLLPNLTPADPSKSPFLDTTLPSDIGNTKTSPSNPQNNLAGNRTQLAARIQENQKKMQALLNQQRQAQNPNIDPRQVRRDVGIIALEAASNQFEQAQKQNPNLKYGANAPSINAPLPKPPATPNETRYAVVAVTTNSNGEVTDAKLTASSGDPAIDEAALKAARQQTYPATGSDTFYNQPVIFGNNTQPQPPITPPTQQTPTPPAQPTQPAPLTPPTQPTQPAPLTPPAQPTQPAPLTPPTQPTQPAPLTPPAQPTQPAPLTPPAQPTQPSAPEPSETTPPPSEPQNQPTPIETPAPAQQPESPTTETPAPPTSNQPTQPAGTAADLKMPSWLPPTNNQTAEPTPAPAPAPAAENSQPVEPAAPADNPPTEPAAP